ncbi:MAG: phosphatidylcholine/phosphatidylserine synthase [Planctomycetes bacterium]|nr:phosphatidylcholine/phosphatidylserine synthase [Planctomycetota bacterium]
MNAEFRKRIRRLKTLPVLPTLLTAGNLASGLTAILFAANDQLLPGAIMVFIAMICDMLDGKVARMTGTDGAFGAELDSLSDVVSFGVAPAILMHRLMLGHPAVFGYGERLLWFCAVFYPVMAAIRLARYNVEHSDEATPYFRGLPSPGAAAVVCSWIILHQKSEEFRGWIGSPLMIGETYHGLGDLDAFRWFLVGIGMVSALTMVSTLRFPHFGNTLLGRMSFRKMIILLLLCAALVWDYAITLALVTTGYLAGGLLYGVYAMFQQWRRGRGVLDDEDDDSAEDAGIAREKDDTAGPMAGR